MTLYTAHIVSFGYGRGAPPTDTTVLVDLRPGLDDACAELPDSPLTARDDRVVQHVGNTPGTRAILRDVVKQVNESAARTSPTTKGPSADREIHIRVAFGCDDGRRHSPALAILTAHALAAGGWHTEIVHRDIDRPALEPARAA